MTHFKARRSDEIPGSVVAGGLQSAKTYKANSLGKSDVLLQLV
jgi:hypothetical protein